jgi:hypothetical protein
MSSSRRGNTAIARGIRDYAREKVFPFLAFRFFRYFSSSSSTSDFGTDMIMIGYFQRNSNGSPIVPDRSRLRGSAL